MNAPAKGKQGIDYENQERIEKRLQQIVDEEAKSDISLKLIYDALMNVVLTINYDIAEEQRLEDPK